MAQLTKVSFVALIAGLVFCHVTGRGIDPDHWLFITAVGLVFASFFLNAGFWNSLMSQRRALRAMRRHVKRQRRAARRDPGGRAA